MSDEDRQCCQRTAKREGRIQTDVHHLSLSPALVLGKLGNHSKRMGKLRLSTTILAKHLVDVAGLEAAQ